MEASEQFYVPAALRHRKSPQYPLDMKLVDSRANLDAVKKKKTCSLLRSQNLVHKASSPYLSYYIN
jgi:uncharacterized protein GlcG (DUF336 family)